MENRKKFKKNIYDGFNCHFCPFAVKEDVTGKYRENIEEIFFYNGTNNRERGQKRRPRKNPGLQNEVNFSKSYLSKTFLETTTAVPKSATTAKTTITVVCSPVTGGFTGALYSS